jgi:integrase
MTKITTKTVNALAPGERITDELITGFAARCLPSGKVTFGYAYTDKKTGKREYIALGMHGAVTADEARDLAKHHAGERAFGKNPAAVIKVEAARAAHHVDYVLDKYLENREREKARSVVAIRGNLAKHVRPALGTKSIYAVKREDIMRLLDRIGEEHRRMPGVIYAYLRAAFNFWMLRDSEFRSPIIKGMVKEKTKIRDRVLEPAELADIWRALDELKDVERFKGGCPVGFAPYVKVLMLTCCRRDEVAFMHTDEIDGDRWVIPAARYKTGHDHVVPLIPAIKKLLPKKIKNGFVFGCASHRHHLAAGAAPLKSAGNLKYKLDKAIAVIRKREGRKAMAPWTYHDLRRTGRTLMAELGIADRVAEGCLGHVIGGVAAHYNHHKYLAEKTAALEKLAARVDEITRSAARATKVRLVAG